MLNDYIEKIKDGLKEELNGVSLTDAEENELYAQAAAELEDGSRDEGLWGKALAKGGSNPEGKYVEYRFKELETELLHQKEVAIQTELARQSKNRKADAKAEKIRYREEKRKRQNREDLVIGAGLLMLVALVWIIAS